jgi:hypothetical protein
MSNGQHRTGGGRAEDEQLNNERILMNLLNRTTIPVLVMAVTSLMVIEGEAGWLDLFKPKEGTGGAATTIAALSETEVANGLKEALRKGVDRAIANLGKENGFLDNAAVKIPMPPQLAKVEKTLRAVGQGAMADEFVATMNHAAEQAVPVAAQVFGESITKMTVEDAKAILAGEDDAATQYFRKTTETQLHEKFLPIVKTATEKAGVTASYKNLMQKAGPVAALLGHDASDLDGYVTSKGLDGLFVMMAAEEKRIRENPVARTTDLLKKVFGSKK